MTDDTGIEAAITEPDPVLRWHAAFAVYSINVEQFEWCAEIDLPAKVFWRAFGRPVFINCLGTGSANDAQDGPVPLYRAKLTIQNPRAPHDAPWGPRGGWGDDQCVAVIGTNHWVLERGGGESKARTAALWFHNTTRHGLTPTLLIPVALAAAATFATGRGRNARWRPRSNR